MNRNAQLITAWCGPIFTGLFAIGGAIIGRFIPTLLHPSDPASVFVANVVSHDMQIRLGAFIMMLSVCFMAPWGAGIAAQTRQKEGNFPALSYAQLACVGCGTAIAMMMAFFWAVMAYRPAEYLPSVVQFAADLAYFMPLFSWPDVYKRQAPHDTPPGSIQTVDLSSGNVRTLYAHTPETPFWGPNDLVFDAHGGFWFTDFGRDRGRMRQRGGVYYLSLIHI